MRQAMRNLKKRNNNHLTAIIIDVPEFIPLEAKLQIKQLLRSITETFRVPILVFSREAYHPGVAKCPFCGRKFSDVSAKRAWLRLRQHIRDKHREELSSFEAESQAIQTPAPRSWGDRPRDEASEEGGDRKWQYKKV